MAEEKSFSIDDFIAQPVVETTETTFEELVAQEKTTVEPTVTVDPVEPTVTKPTKEDVVIPRQDIIIEDSGLAKTIQSLITSGVLPQPELEEGEVLDLNDPKTAQDLLKQQIDFLTKDAKNSLLEKLPDGLKKAIEIHEKGGDYLSILKVQETVKNPLDSIDMTTDEGIITAYDMSLRKYNPGLTQEERMSLIEIASNNGTLEQKAVTGMNKLKEDYEEFVKYQSKEAEERQKQNIEKEKAVKASMRSVYKDQLKLSDIAIKKIIDNYSKKDSNNEYEIDRIYATKIQDPEIAPHIAFLLTDPTGYLKAVRQPVVEEIQAKAFKMVKNASEKKRGQPTEMESRSVTALRISDLPD